MAKTPKTAPPTATKQINPNDLERFVPKQDVADKFGRPTKITLQVLQDLKYAFLLDCPNKEAALYAGISESTYYYFLDQMDEELRSDFSELVEGWKNDTILTARKTLRVAVSKAEHAKWLLERRRKNEYAPRTQHEVKEVSEFENLTDEELEKLANAGNSADQSPNRTGETQE